MTVVFDVGFYDGVDSEYYLSRGYRVIAFEANPYRVEAGRKKFRSAIEGGQLILNHLGIGKDAGAAIDFFVHTDNDEWSTFYREAALNWGTGKFRIIQVPCLTPSEAFQRFGCPDYLKVDIEGYDHYIAAELANQPLKPQYVSFEASSVRIFRDLLLAGYRSFKVIDQAKVPLQIVRDGSREFHFAGGTGPFGKDLTGAWLSFENAIYFFMRFVHDPFSPSTPDGHWFDVHAAQDEPADHYIQLNEMKALIEDTYAAHCGMGLKAHKPICPASASQRAAG
jgi:FkbM family methyltransferase